MPVEEGEAFLRIGHGADLEGVWVCSRWAEQGVDEVDASTEVKSWHAESLVTGQGPQGRQG